MTWGEHSVHCIFCHFFNLHSKIDPDIQHPTATEHQLISLIEVTNSFVFKYKTGLKFWCKSHVSPNTQMITCGFRGKFVTFVRNKNIFLTCKQDQANRSTLLPGITKQGNRLSHFFLTRRQMQSFYLWTLCMLHNTPGKIGSLALGINQVLLSGAWYS